MSRIDLDIAMPEGSCRAALFTPAGEGPWPGVIFYMDALGYRQAMWDMGQELADKGYAVLLPDLFYRDPHEPMIPSETFSDPAKLQNLLRLVGTLTPERKTADSAVYIDVLRARSEVKGEKLGSTGYCMGGNVALSAAGAHKQAFAAIGSFHAGGLATDQPQSPHRHVDGIAGHVYVAGADQDDHFTDAQKAMLEEALSAAGVSHVVETYVGAHHGFAVPDHPAFSVDASKRHWDALDTLFATQLR